MVNIMYVPVDILKFIIITSSHISISILHGVFRWAVCGKNKVFLMFGAFNSYSIFLKF